MSAGFIVSPRRSKSDGKRKPNLLSRSASLLPTQLNPTTRQSKKEIEEIIVRLRNNDPGLNSVTIREVRATTNTFNDLLGALELNTTITKLDVSNNSLQDLGVCEIFNRLMISGNKCIRNIDVWWVPCPFLSFRVSLIFFDLFPATMPSQKQQERKYYNIYRSISMWPIFSTMIP